MKNSTTPYQTAYSRLNPAQKQAVDTIDGPLLVLAGPGTGKTQLLSARVANILQKTDVDASNILCLTFTESGAANMRARLRQFIGEAAYEVTISTYHSFGSDLIKSHSEYFQEIGLDRTDDVRLERPVDELTQLRIVEDIVAQLPFDSPLLSARYYLKDVVSTISDLKQHLITPKKLRSMAASNLAQIDTAQPILDELINHVGGISRKKEQLISQYAKLLSRLSTLSGSLVEFATQDLKTAFDEAQATSSSKPLTVWKNNYLFKNDHDQFVFTDYRTSQKMLELAGVYESYEKELRSGAMYDYNDMITRASLGLKKHNELRYNLQERYQYILLDEFQDTNPAQFELVKILANHPVHEGRPNVMAVGDDDQAIFAFQGASIGNIQDFLDTFRDVQVINLVHNYRSHKDVLHLAQNVRTQIGSKLHPKLKDINKILLESSRSLPVNSTIIRSALPSAATEYAWVAQQIKQLLTQGTKPEEIAIIAPKHSHLESVVPFLNNLSVPVSYEKKENILESVIVKLLHQSALLLDSLITNDQTRINQYFPLVLSHPYWNIAPLEIWRINWQFAKNAANLSWAELAQENPALAHAVTFYLSLTTVATTSPLEILLDRLIVDTPLKNYYFTKAARDKDALTYYEALTHLSTIRTRLRDYQNNTSHTLTLSDFLDFFALYESAGEGLINTHPIAQGKHSVQLLTAHKAKGLEFDHVFILHNQDEVWGSASRSRSSNLALPPNLRHIRYSHSGDDERLRLYFVSITRARHGLYLSSHTHNDMGKPTTPLKYLLEGEGISPHLPQSFQKIDNPAAPPLELGEHVATLWTAGRLILPVNFRDLLSERLESYVMSPTHLNTFMDLEYGGPEEFLVNTLLRFPSAPTLESEYGQAIHNTLEWYQQQLGSGHNPPVNDVVAYYKLALSSRHLSQIDKDNMLAKGELVLKKYLSSRVEMFQGVAKTEVNFYTEGVALGEARLTGKIDRLEIDPIKKTLRIVDFKTGTPVDSWGSSLKAYKYRHQLYFYKFLVEGSRTWRGYKVIEARLEFVEPQDLRNGEIKNPLIIQFSEAEEREVKSLIKVVWDKIQNLDFPETSHYHQNLQGTKSFERDLLA